MIHLRTPEKIRSLMVNAQKAGMVVQMFAAFEQHADGQWVRPDDASITTKIWARLLSAYDDLAVMDAVLALAGDGVEYLDVNKLAGRCKLIREKGQGPAKAADARRAQECPDQRCDGSGTLQVRLPRPPPRQGAPSPGLLWAAALCTCDLASPTWRNGATPTGEGAHLFRGERVSRGLRDARETLRGWLEGPALLDHIACVEAMSDDVQMGAAAGRVMVWELTRDHRRLTEQGDDPERLAAIEDEIATLQRLASERISPRLAGLRTLEAQVDLAVALGATAPAWVADALSGVREPQAAQVAK